MVVSTLVVGGCRMNSGEGWVVWGACVELEMWVRMVGLMGR